MRERKEEEERKEKRKDVERWKVVKREREGGERKQKERMN